MQKDPFFSLRHRVLRRFRRSEDGSFTIEFVIWMPMFAILLAIVMNLSMMFYYESQMLRVAQDATRSFSLGRMTDVEAEAFIADRLSSIEANFNISTTQVGGVAQTIVSTNANELMPFSLLRFPFQGVPVGVSTQYLIEF